MKLLLKNLLFTLLVPGTVAVWLPAWLFAVGDLRDIGWIQGLGGGLLISGGFGLYLACAWPFAVTGQGTPAPMDAPRRLIVSGPYRYLRNPMYVAVLLVIAGQGWLFASPGHGVYAAIVASLFVLFVAGYEEPILRRRFPGEYQAYCDRVPAWWPRRPQAAKDRVD